MQFLGRKEGYFEELSYGSKTLDDFWGVGEMFEGDLEDT